LPTIRHCQPETQPQGSRLASAVRPQQAIALAALQRERHIVDYDMSVCAFAVGFTQMFNSQDGHKFTLKKQSQALGLA
jgi:hypothetical protein